MTPSDRRTFLKTAAVLGAGMTLPVPVNSSPVDHAPAIAAGKPVVISSVNGLEASALAMKLIQEGKDALDAVIAGVNLVEDDPNDMSVGYGGLPNEDGVVELDASVMHGPTGRGGAVASLRNIKNPSKVARIVMERSDHVLIVGEGALRFAKAHGFQEENLLTEAARQRWLEWKENLSTKDDWLPAHTIETEDIGSTFSHAQRPTGTIHCSALDRNGNISACTTTSGLAYKIPGRVGDSPILGAGLYVDNEVGAAGSTGRGEANLLSCASFLVVESMRNGSTPEEACLKACRRVADMTKMHRLLDKKGRPAFEVKYYAINKKGEFGSASIWSGGRFSINTGDGPSRHVESAYLFKRDMNTRLD